MMVMRALCSSTCGTPAAVATLVAPRLGGVCAFSAGAQTVTDQMIAYAMQQFKAAPDQAIDVLKSGLSMQPGGKGVDAARLLLAQGTLEADRSSWAAALACATEATAAVHGEPGEAAAAAGVQAGRLAVAAHLTQGHDAEAVSQCDASTSAVLTPGAHSSSPAFLAALALRLSTRHALAQAQHAQHAADQLSAALASSSSSAGAGSGPQHRLARAQAWLALGDFSAGGWTVGGAAASRAAADLYGEAAREVQGGDAAAPVADSLAGSEAGLVAREVRAAALLGAAQLHVQAERWDEAEEALGHAMSAAEGVSTDKHPCVVPALLLLGTVYSRSARVTFAEGLFREVAKILKVDPTAPPSSARPQAQLVHPSVAALLAWRFHQLLTALPNRGREAAAWGHLAADAWSKARLQARDGDGSAAVLEAVLGHPQHLSGQGPGGAGVLLSLPLRRLLLTRQAVVTATT